MDKISFCFQFFMRRAKIRTCRETSCQLLPRKVTVSLPERSQHIRENVIRWIIFQKEENNKQMNYTTSTFSNATSFLSLYREREKKQNKNTVSLYLHSHLIVRFPCVIISYLFLFDQISDFVILISFFSWYSLYNLPSWLLFN